MSKVSVYNSAGKSAGEIDVSDDLLLLGTDNGVVHDVVVAQAAAKRAGTASTRSKGEVAGSNRKPWRQKGTGRARAGYRQSPIWRGGGVAFGPKPRDYSKKVNKKVKVMAFRCALSERIADGGLRILEELEIAEPKTKLFVQLLERQGIDGAVLIIQEKVTKNIRLAVRNIPMAEVVEASKVNTVHMVRYPSILVDKDGMDRLKSRLGGEVKGAK